MEFKCSNQPLLLSLYVKSSLDNMLNKEEKSNRFGATQGCVMMRLFSILHDINFIKLKDETLSIFISIVSSSKWEHTFRSDSAAVKEMLHIITLCVCKKRAADDVRVRCQPLSTSDDSYRKWLYETVFLLPATPHPITQLGSICRSGNPTICRGPNKWSSKISMDD